MTLNDEATSLEFAGGLTYKMNTRLSLYTQAGYQFAVAPGNVKRNGFTGNIGLRYTFGAPPALPPTPAFAPLPPAVTAPARQEFIVFFDFDKSTLTPEGRRVVDAAATAFKTGKTNVAISGHTDTVGTEQYNLALSRRRADAVAAALVRDGVPASAIDKSYHGFSQLRVPTAQGVLEPQNRRVEITM